MAHTEGQTRPSRAYKPRGRWIGRVAVLGLLALVCILLIPSLSGAASSATTSATTTTTWWPDERIVVPILFPFLERRPWQDDWGAPRSGHRHEGNDILAPKGTPVLAVVDGTLDWMNFEGKISCYNPYPYYNILLRGDDGNDYFYVHLNNDSPDGKGGYTDDGLGGPEHAYAPGLRNGSRVKAGQIIGYTGDSGNAEDSIPHLHFEIHIGGWKNPRNPYWSLMAAPTYDEWKGTVTTTATTTTTLVTTTVTTRPPGGQLDPGLARFSDVTQNDWFYPDLELLYVAGIVKGSAQGRFFPYANITRAQFTAFLARAFLPDKLAAAQATSRTFGDVGPSYWAYPEIQAAAQVGLVRGTESGRFFPDSNITRAQMAAMLARAAETLGIRGDQSLASNKGRPLAFSDVSQSYWARVEILRVAELGIMEGRSDGAFRPESKAERAQAVAVLARMLRLYRAEKEGE